MKLSKTFRPLLLGCLLLSIVIGPTTRAGAEEKQKIELTTKDYAEGAKDAAIVIGAGVTGGGIVGATIAAGVVLNDRLDQANAAADKRNEQLDQQLKDQKAELCRESGRYCD